MTVHASANGQLMEGTTGAALGDVRIRNGQRQSVFRSYVFPLMDRPNLTVLTRALVQRIVVDGDKAVGVEILYNGLSRRVDAGAEVVLSLGANHTPKVLMLSGIGDQDELNRVGIPVRQHLPGVGRNLQDHVAFDCVWEYRDALPPRNNACEVVALGATESGLTHPDVFAWQVEVPYATEETAARFGLPEAGWGSMPRSPIRRAGAASGSAAPVPRTRCASTPTPWRIPRTCEKRSRACNGAVTSPIAPRCDRM